MNKLWLKIPEKYRKEIESAAHTFVSVFIVTLMATWDGNVPTSKDALFALLVTAVRVAWKAVYLSIKNAVPETK